MIEEEKEGANNFNNINKDDKKYPPTYPHTICLFIAISKIIVAAISSYYTIKTIAVNYLYNMCNTKYVIFFRMLLNIMEWKSRPNIS